MIYAISSYLTLLLLREQIILEEEREVYTYGFEITIANGINALIIFCVGETMIAWKGLDVKADLSRGGPHCALFKRRKPVGADLCPPFCQKRRGPGKRVSMSSIPGHFIPCPDSPESPPLRLPDNRPGAPGGPRRKEAHRRWSPPGKPPGQSCPLERGPRA